MSAGSPPDRFLTGLAVLSLLPARTFTRSGPVQHAALVATVEKPRP